MGNNNADIRLLIGAEGGSSTGGDLIRKELGSYFKDGFKLKVKLDDIDIDSIKARISEQQKSVSNTKAEVDINKQLEKSFERAATLRKKTQRTDELKQANEINKNLEREYELRLKNQQVTKKSSQEYWDGRFKDSVEDLTASNTVLEQMNQYYKELEKSSAQLVSNNEKLSKTTANVNANASLQKSTFQKYLQTLKPSALKEYSTDIQDIFDNLDIAANSSGETAQEAFKKAQNGAKKFKGTMKDVGAEGGNIFTYLENKIKTFAVYLMSSAITMNLVKGFKNAVTSVYDLNEALTSLRIVTGSSDESAKSLLATYNKMAQVLGSTTVVVAESANDWLRQGYNVADTEELIKDSMVLSIVGDMDSDEATSALTAALKGYQLQVSEVMGVIDKFTAVDMEAATSSGKLAAALAKTAANAKISGLSLNNLIAQLAVVNETMAETGEETGTFYNTMLSRMGAIKSGNLIDPESAESLSDVETTLNRLGINLRDTSNEFRNFGVVLDEVGQGWESYDSVTQRAIAQSFAGTRQQTRFISLMEGWAQVQEYAQTATDSAGTAMKKFEIHQESLEAKQNKLTSAFENFANSIIPSGLLGWLLDVGSAILNFSSGIGGIPIKVAGITVAVIALVGAYRALKVSSWGKGIKQTVLSLKQFGASIKRGIGLFKEARVAGLGFSDSLKSVKASAAGTQTAINSALGVIGILISVISLVAMGIGAVNAKEEEARRKSIEASDAANERAKSLSELYAQYNKLSNITSKTNEQEQEFKTLQEQISKALGDRTKQLEGLTAGTDEYTKALKKATNEDLNKLKVEAIAGQKAAKKDLNDVYGLWGNPKGILLPRSQIEKYFAEYVDEYNEALSYQESYGIEEGSAYFQFSTDELTGYKDAKLAMSLLVDEYGKLYNAGNIAEAELLSSSLLWKELEDQIRKLKDPVQAYIDQTTQLAYLNEVTKNGLPETAEEFDALSDSIFNATGLNEFYRDAVNEIISEYLPSLASQSSKATGANLGLSSSMYGSADAIKAYNERLSTLNKNLSSVVDIQKSLAEGNTLTYDQLNSLLEIYPDLNKSIDINAQNYGITIEVLDQVRQAMYDAEKQQIESEISKTEVTLREAEKRIQIYELEIEAALGDVSATEEKRIATQKAINEYKSNLNGLNARLIAIGQAGSRSYNDIADSTKSAKEAADNLTNSLKEQKSALSDSKSAIDDLLGDIITLIKHEKQEQLDILKEQLEAEEEAIKKSLEIQKEEKESYYDDLYEMRDEYYESEIEQAESALSAFEKEISLRKELLDLAEDELQYQRQLEQKQKGITSLQSEIADLSFDDTREAKNRVRELTEQLEEERQGLGDLQRQNNTDNQKKALDDELDAYKEMQEQRIKLLQDEQSAELDSINARKDADIKAFEEANNAKESALSTSLKNQIADIQKYLREEGTIRSDAMKLMETQSTELYNKLIEYNKVYGTSTTAEVIEKWNRAYEELKKVNQGQLSVSETLEKLVIQMFSYDRQIASAATEAERLATALAELPDVSRWVLDFEKVGGIANDIANAVIEVSPTSPLSNEGKKLLKQDYEDQVTNLRKQNASKLISPKTRAENEAEIKRLQGLIGELNVYHEGTWGVGNKTTKAGETLALLENGESVLNESMMKNILGNIASLARVGSSSYITNNKGTSFGNITFNIKSTLDGNSTGVVANDMFNQFSELINKRGILSK